MQYTRPTCAANCGEIKIRFQIEGLGGALDLAQRAPVRPGLRQLRRALHHLQKHRHVFVSLLSGRQPHGLFKLDLARVRHHGAKLERAHFPGVFGPLRTSTVDLAMPRQDAHLFECTCTGRALPALQTLRRRLLMFLNQTLSGNTEKHGGALF